MGEACSAYASEGRRIQGFGGETKENRSLGRPRFRWEDNIKIDVQNVGAWTRLIWFRIGRFGGHL